MHDLEVASCTSSINLSVKIDQEIFNMSVFLVEFLQRTFLLLVGLIAIDFCHTQTLISEMLSPIPGSSFVRGTFIKHLFNERLWRIEF